MNVRPRRLRDFRSGCLAIAACLLCGFERPRTTNTVATDPVDIFLVAGQSNASGYPDSSEGSPIIPHGQVLQYYHGRIYDANDPVGNAHPGSAWPEAGLVYYRLTGRKVLFVPAAVPATSLTAAGDFFNLGHWDESGKLFGNSMAVLASARQALGSHACFKGVLWDQGESDALEINLKRQSTADYERELKRLIARFRRELGPSTPFYLFETGTSSLAPLAGFLSVRSAQEDVARNLPLTPAVFSTADTFEARGLMSESRQHYSQAGYNEMGRLGAQGIVQFLKYDSRLQGGPGLSECVS